jgi:hypothetical protein
MTPGSNPYLFVVGAARSGTTRLQRMLDAHPLLAVVNETYWLPRRYSSTSTRFARRSPRTSVPTTGLFHGAGDMTAQDARA